MPRQPRAAAAVQGRRDRSRERRHGRGCGGGGSSRQLTTPIKKSRDVTSNPCGFTGPMQPYWGVRPKVDFEIGAILAALRAFVPAPYETIHRCLGHLQTPL